ncbi:MAG: hypothetical protein ACYTGY_04815 [Planctomycetota bacterium]|jgi:hypothetical protein
MRSSAQKRQGSHERANVATACAGSPRSRWGASTHQRGMANAALSSSAHSKESPHSVQVPVMGHVASHVATAPRRS